MELLLFSFLHSVEEPERERSLSELLLVHAAPVVRHTLRQKLGFYVDHKGANPHNPEAEDLYQDVIAKLIGKLNELKANPDQPAIRSFRQYVTSIAVNSCHDYLRSKSPARSRLKNNLRDLLDRHPDFQVWKGELNETVCGFAAWRDQKLLAMSDLLKQPGEIERFEAASFPGEDIRSVPLTRIVAEVFNWMNRPVAIEMLVDVVGGLHGIKDYTAESLDDDDAGWSQRLVDKTIRCDTALEVREMLQRLWDEIRRLPERQRDAICFSFEDTSGDDLFSLLLDAEIVTLPQLAHELDLPLNRLMVLWGRMPMDNVSIAAEFGATRQQVNKWRFRALKHLEKQLIVSLTER